MTSSIIVSTPGVDDAGSAATSVSFALLRDVIVLKVRDVPSSLWATAAFRWAGARSAIVIVEGRHPVLYTAGSITCGRLFLESGIFPPPCCGRASLQYAFRHEESGSQHEYGCC